MTGKVCIVTGTSSGIGKVTARELARMGATVVAVSRDPARGERAAQDIRRETGRDVDLMLADLSSQSEVRALAARFLERYDRLDVLVNNAGALYTSRQVTIDGLERTFATNHLAYFLLTHLLLDVVRRSAPARIINVSSRAHVSGSIDFDDLQAERRFSPGRAYSQSKLANVLFTYELARRLAGTGVAANALHPGVVRTGFAKNNDGVIGRAAATVMRGIGVFFIGPEEGAKTSVYLATSPEVEGVTGKYFARSREAPSSAASHDAETARRLWEVSERLCGIVPAAAAT